MHNSPQRALVRVPIEDGTAIQLEPVEVPVTKVRDALVADYACPLDDPLFDVAVVRCQLEPGEDDTVIADLAHNARRLEDHTPFSSDPRDISGRPYLWTEPAIAPTRFEPLPPTPGGFRDSTEAAEVAAAWFSQFEPVSPAALAPLMDRWRRQVKVVVADATERAEPVRSAASPDERARLDNLMASLRRRVSYPPDPESDGEFDEDGEFWAWSWGYVINSCAMKIADTAEKLRRAAVDRARKEGVQREVAALVAEYKPQLSERLRLVSENGLLDQSLGAARAEFLELLRPGWEFFDGKLQEAVNPPLAVLQAFVEIKADEAPGGWLAYRPQSPEDLGGYVVADEFLGRLAVTPAANNRPHRVA